VRLDFEDTFDGRELDRSRWLPWYLPHWSSRERAAARYELRDGGLRLRIDPGQQPWCPEWDGEVRVSSLQTGQFSGPVGSRVGQHRFHADAVVREEQESVRLYTQRYGRVELRARATDHPDAMVALWLIGFEDEPERSGELCVCEIFGRDVGERESKVGVGVHPFGDPALEDDFEQVSVPLDVTEPHEYRADWTPAGVVFAVDGEIVKTTAQSPAYPLQLMLSLYEFPAGGERRPETYPRVFDVEAVRGFRLA
jgi:hypothetical protein